MDFLTIESGKSDKVIYVLVVTDHFMCYAQAYIIQSQTASVVTRMFWDKFFVNYWLPEKIISDQGRNFESSPITELCQLAQVKKLMTTPYRPQTNGQCERFNTKLISIIDTLLPGAKTNWQEQVPTLVHAYNCTWSNAMAFSPYYLMYGRHPLLPIDIEFGVHTPDIIGTSTHNYIQKLHSHIQWAYQKAQEINANEIQCHKHKSNYKVCCAKLESGNHVLVSKKAFKGKHKVQDMWENVYYQVVDWAKGLPAYKIQYANAEGVSKVCVLHYSMLFPLL